MKTLKITNKLMLITLLVTLSIATYGQKGMNIEIIANPGMSMGGDFQVPQNLNSTQSWTSLSKSFTFGVNTGAALGYNFTDQMGLSLGMLYSHQGQNYADYTWTVTGGSVTWKRSVSLNYFKIPVQFNFISSSEKQVSFIGSAGFYLGFLLSYTDENSAIASDGSSFISTASGATLTQTYTDNSGTDTESAAFLSKPYNSSDFGGILAVGLQFKLSDKISMPLMLNYQIGFSDVKNQSSQYTQSNSSNADLFWQGDNNNSPNATLPYRNSSLGLKIGLKISL